MKITYIFIGFALLVITSLFIYFASATLSQSNELSHHAPEKSVDNDHPSQSEYLHFELLDVAGNIRSTTEWQDKVVVFNFWATWCPPCIREIPLFIELQEKYHQQGLQLVGIAVDELKSVKSFMTRMEVNYPLLVEAQKAIEIAGSLGNENGVLPFTVVVNKSGKIVARHLGEFTQTEVEQILIPLLQTTAIPVIAM